ncbi:MAG TPA: hypothetical protein VIF15_06350 [Polyangiaceae bacterium]
MSASPDAASAAAAWLGTWSRPPDRPAQVALGAAVALLAIALVPGGPRWLASALDFTTVGDLTRRRRFLTVAAFVAAFLSLGYIAFYLRGGPRAPDAAAYWLEGRAMSHGELAWAAPEPSASFRARFLLFAPPDRLAGIFPPGYPLLLAAGFLVGAPMLVGPLLAAILVAATWWLAHEVAASAGESGPRAEAIARVAAGLSIVSAALRYHTADALPYGAAAVALVAALASALCARRTGDPRFFGAAGLAVGLLAATNPASAVAAGAVVTAMASGASRRARALAWACAAALPGVLLLLAADHAALGRAFASPSAAYFAMVEPHAATSTAGGIAAALRRLRLHLVDAANFEPLALLSLVPLLVRGRARGAVLVALVVAGQLALSLPLDADPASSGGGARMLVCVLPLEHALIALALARLFPRSLARAAMATLALALAGFAVHASHEHDRLAASDLGRPRFEPDVAREANVAHGLLFFDDDQGYELAHDPGVLASHGIQAVRMRGDDHDRLLYDSLGHPVIHRYVAAGTSASLVFWSPPGSGSDTWRFEAESDWPPLLQGGGAAQVVDASAACGADGRVLTLTPAGDAEAAILLALPVPRGPTPPERKTWMVTPRVLESGAAGSATLVLVAGPGGPPLAQWMWEEDASKTPSCLELPSQPVELGGDLTRAWLLLRARGGPVSLDRTTLRPR